MLHFLAEAAIDPDMPSRTQSLWQSLTMVAIMIAFFYFIFWRPERKRRRELEEQTASLKQGDRVSALGIIGTIVRVKDNTVIVKMYDGSKLEFYKGAIAEVLPPSDEKDDV